MSVKGGADELLIKLLFFCLYKHAGEDVGAVAVPTQPQPQAAPNKYCISKKAASRRPPSEASVYRSRAVKREIRQRASARGAVDRIN